jgi:hypothetical protein
LTCNEIQHLFAALLVQPTGVDINTAPAPATTDGKPPNHDGHGLQLACQVGSSRQGP